METFDELIGLGVVQPDTGQIIARAVFVFFLSFIFLRIAGVRTFGKKSIFDQITLFSVGAILGRSVVATSPFLSSMVAVLIFVLLHRVIAFIAYKSVWARNLINGKPVRLMKDGVFDLNEMRKAQITKDEILISIRLNGQINGIELIKECYLEPSGDISVIKKENT